jgi:voltage-dependent potassium channel beta subunit
MNYRRLGKSGLQVSELSLGSWITFGNQISDDIAEELMIKAYDSGVNFFDNAEVYAHGKSEEVMGNILKRTKWSRDSYIVSSKAFFGDGGTLPTQKGLHRKHLVEACNAALKRFQLDYIDLYFCHRPDKQTPIEETVWTMNHLIQQGKILYWGTSEWSAQEIMEAHMVAKEYKLIGPTMEQPQYNLFHREKMENEFLQIFKTVGLGTTIWSPLASGVLTNKYLTDKPTDTRFGYKGLAWLKERNLTEEKLQKSAQLHELAKEIGTTLPKLAIAWCLVNINVSTVILGASKIHQLEETLKSAEVLPSITQEVIDRIEFIMDNKPVLPQF